MTSKIEISKNKLNRLLAEKENLLEEIEQEQSTIPLGQPIIEGRPNPYKKVNKLYTKLFNLSNEIKNQKMLIDKFHKIEDFKKENSKIKDVHVNGKSSYAKIGAKTSVANLDYFRDKLKNLITKNEEAKQYNKTRSKGTPLAKTYGSEITKSKNKIKSLENMKKKSDNTVLGPLAQKLVEDRKVRQWKKKPIYYFVQGLRKVAFEVDENGQFFESSLYPPKTDEERIKVAALLRGDEEI